MDYSKYKSTENRPIKSEFKTIYWYQNGKTVAVRQYHTGVLEILVPGVKPTDLEHIKTMEICYDMAAYSLAKEQFAAYEDAVLQRFKADLFIELGIQNNPKRELLFNTAWKLGDRRFESAFNYAEDLVDLITD